MGCNKPEKNHAQIKCGKKGGPVKLNKNDSITKNLIQLMPSVVCTSCFAIQQTQHIEFK